MRALDKKVLVVDDDPVIAHSFDRVLSGKGYIVVSASNAREALDKIRGEEYDLIFTDIRMPGMDGIDMAEKVKSRRPWVPVVIITGYGTEANEARAEAAGVSEFIRKPLSPEMIEASASRALGATSRAPAAEAGRAPAKASEEPTLSPPAPRRQNSPAKAIGMAIAAPFIGLVYAIAFPFFGLGALAVLAGKALREPCARAARFAKNVLLFFAAPFIGLAYVIAFPFVALAMLAWIGARALVRRPRRRA